MTFKTFSRQVYDHLLNDAALAGQKLKELREASCRAGDRYMENPTQKNWEAIGLADDVADDFEPEAQRIWDKPDQYLKDCGILR